MGSGLDAEQCCKCGSVTVQVQDEPRNGCGWGSCLGGHAINCASSHPLGDNFEARSCGAPFSGMNMDTNWSKSASATLPPPRTARAQRRVIQHATNWHAFPVFPPLTELKLKKNIITTMNPVVFLHFHTKLGGPTDKQGTQKKDRLGWAMGFPRISISGSTYLKK